MAEKMEPTTGIEPVNLILTKDALYQLSYVGPLTGAGNGTRTRNPQLGRLTLWPLSYSRFLRVTYGGEGRIRTSVGYANGFTARPLWPLGYLSRCTAITLPGAGDGTRTRNLLITNQPLYH
jgi:hypothetical protein